MYLSSVFRNLYLYMSTSAGRLFSEVRSEDAYAQCFIGHYAIQDQVLGLK